MYVCMYVGMYVGMYVCMYVCRYVCMYVYVCLCMYVIPVCHRLVNFRVRNIFVQLGCS